MSVRAPVNLDGLPFRVAEHELLRQIRTGSYGEVWLARNELGRHRAVKVVQQARFDSSRPFQREYEGIEKFEPVSRIHEGLVDILQVGRISPDCFYYVMELADDQVSGQRIDPATYQPRTLESEVVAKGRLPVLECIEIGIRLCQTLAFIHDQGLIHRDVKPSNVIFIDGQPKLADIGLIADVRDAKTYVGTTGFIPPEGPNSPQADLYSLGKLLYEISTGQDRNDFPTLPDQTGFSDDFLELNEVLLKSCHPDLSERYASARAMESDLKLIADGRSVRRLHQLETTLKRMQRWGAVAAVILLVCGAFYYEWNQRAQQAREETERLLGGKIAQGTTLLRNGNLLGSLPSFVEAWQLEGRKRESDSNHRLRIGSILAACPVLRTNWHLPGRPLRSCRVHGDKVLLTTQYQYWQVFDLHTGQALSKPIGSKDRPSMAVFTPDGGAVLVANFEESAQVIDWKTGEILVNMPHPCPLYSAAMSEDGQHIITGCADGAVYLWDYQGRLQGTLEGHRGHVRGVQLNANGSLAVTTSEDKTARVWDIASATCRHVLRHRNWVYCAAISPDERFIATACYDNSVTLWSTQTGEEIEPPLTQLGAVFKVEFTHQGSQLLTAGLDGAVRLWDRRSHQPVTFNHTLQHSTKLMDASMSSDGQVVVAAGVDGTVTIWDFAGLPAQPSPADALAPPETSDADSPNDWQFVSHGPARCVLEHGPTHARIEFPVRRAVTLVVFDHALTHAACAAGTNVHLVDLRKNNVTVLSHPDPITFLAFSPNGAKLICATEDKTLDPRSAQLWDVPSGRRIGHALQHDDGVIFACFSPDGATLATASEDSSARLWDTSTGEAKAPKLSHGEKVRYAAFAHTKPWLATASDDLTAMIWDAKTGDPLTPPFKHQRPVIRVEFVEGDTALLTTEEGGVCWKWVLPIERRPPGDVAKQVWALAGLRSSER